MFGIQHRMRFFDPQTHRAIYPWRGDFPRHFLCLFGNNHYLCTCYLPKVAAMSSEEDGAAGWSTTY